MSKKLPNRATPKSRDALWIYGTHAAVAALKNPDRCIRRWVITARALEALEKFSAPLKPEMVDADQLRRLLKEDAVDQGIAVLVEPLADVFLEDILRENPEDCLLLMLDQVTDPHNVGAILRSALAFGVKAVIAPQNHAPQLSGVLAKSASGALEQLPLVYVANLAQTLGFLKEQGYWSYGLDERGQSLREQGLFAPAKKVVVMGAEGKGLRPLTKTHCDYLISIPTIAAFSTLNVSNATAVVLYALGDPS